MVTASTLDKTLKRGWRGANEEQPNTEGVGVLLGTLEGRDEEGNKADHCVVSPRGEQLRQKY